MRVQSGLYAYPATSARALEGVTEKERSEDVAPVPEDTVETESARAAEAQGGLTEVELRIVEALRKRDAEVRAHEAAHAAAGGAQAGAPSFTYERGPDGRSYAVGGEVPIDMSPGRTPEETISKAQRIRAAATAPANPSAQDMRVAARAAAMEMAARLEQLQLEIATRKAEADVPHPAGSRVYRNQGNRESSVSISV